MHCSVLSNQKEVQQNNTHEEIVLGISIIVNETDNLNDVTEKKFRKKDKKPNNEQKKGKSVAILGDSMVTHLNG